MICWAVVEIGFIFLQREVEADGNLVKKQLIQYSEMSMTDQITWLNTFAYRVGQLGVIR